MDTKCPGVISLSYREISTVNVYKVGTCGWVPLNGSDPIVAKSTAEISLQIIIIMVFNRRNLVNLISKKRNFFYGILNYFHS